MFDVLRLIRVDEAVIFAPLCPVDVEALLASLGTAYAAGIRAKPWR